ncbi:hypothetical protein BGZ70_008077 [Mortierella alpina]|uniref:Carbonic anhydrase n=1 Tax=Mortierella alpina TaxID=64518 RepID=A0A9P6M212_MORAP|nr:hypothetical protein BGZ70_008077 [Mortierella alpina]
MKITLNLALTVAALATVVSALPTQNKETLKKRDEHWTYGQNRRGPQHWGTLDPKYGTCGKGQKQSPIDIAVGAPDVKLQNAAFAKLNYQPLQNVLCGYSGHSVECKWNTTQPAVENSLKIKNKTYNLKSFHFHTPSEHRVDDHFFEAELHLVHQTDTPDKALAVVGVLLEVTAEENPFFNWITVLADKVTGQSKSGKEKVKHTVDRIDFKPLLNDTGNFTPRWEYEGSLTTPPCTEGVAWNVVKTPVRLGLKQYRALTGIESFNSRFIQDRQKKDGDH